jgi:hypothetical protein
METQEQTQKPEITLGEILGRAEIYEKFALDNAVEDIALAILSYMHPVHLGRTDPRIIIFSRKILDSPIPCKRNGMPQASIGYIALRLDNDIRNHVNYRLSCIAKCVSEEALHSKRYASLRGLTEPELGLGNIEVL